MQTSRPPIYLVVFTLLILSLASTSAAQVTLLYEKEPAPLFGEDMAALCAYAQSSGVAVQCVQVDTAGMENTVNTALQSGPVILPTREVYASWQSYVQNVGQRIHTDSLLPQIVKSAVPVESYGIFTIAHIPALFYNRNLMSELGNSQIQTFTTWNPFIFGNPLPMAKASLATKAEVGQHGIGLAWDDILAAWLATTNELDSPFWPYGTFRLTLGQLTKLQQSGVRLSDIDWQEAWQAFREKKLPVVLGYLSQVDDLPADLNWAVTPLPGDCSYNSLQLMQYWSLLDTAQSETGWQVYRWLFLDEGAEFLARRYPLSMNLLSLMHATTLPVNLEVRGVGKVLSAATRIADANTGSIWRSPTVKLAVQNYLNGSGNLNDVSTHVDEVFRTLVNIPTPEFLISKADMVKMPLNGNQIAGIEWAPGGNLLAYGSEAGLHITDPSTKSILSFYPKKTQAIAWSPNGNFVAFVVDQRAYNHNYSANDIILHDVRSGQQLEITPSELNDNQPAWSPNGTQLAFSSVMAQRNTEILTTDEIGNSFHNVTSSPTHDTDAQWMPDGKQLLFLSERSGSGKELYIANADGSDVRPLIQGVLINDYLVSPDGTQVAYLSTSGNSKSESLSILDLGSRQTKLILEERYDVRCFVWSPDSSKLAVTVKSDLFTQLGVVYPRLDKMESFYIRGEGGYFSWSPDGRYIALGGYYQMQNALLVVPANNEGPVGVLALGRRAQFPAWSPDGTMLAYAVIDDRAYTEGIYITPVSELVQTLDQQSSASEHSNPAQ